MDPTAILRLIARFMGGGANMQSIPYGWGMPQHVTTGLSYQPNALSKMAMDWLMPYRQQLAPPTILQSDMEYIRRMSQARSMYQPAGMNPMVYRMMQMGLTGMLGQRQGQNILNSIAGNQLVVGGINQLFGGGGIAEKGAAFQDIHRYLSGTAFYTSAGQGMPEKYTLQTSRTIANRLYGLAYKDPTGLFKRFQSLGARDMSDIMRLGLDYGMRVPLTKEGTINTDRLVGQTRDLAKVIDAGMAIYHTMDKEKVIQNIMELTRGRIPITNTTTLENMMYRLSSLAKTAGVSVDYMQRIASEGAALFERVGVSGATGGPLAAGLVGIARRMTQAPHAARLPGMPSPVLTPAEISRIGGAQAVQRMLPAQVAEVMGSWAYGKTGLLYAAAKEGVVSGGLSAQEVLNRFKLGKEPDMNEERRIDAALMQKYSKMLPGESQAYIRKIAMAEKARLQREGKAAIPRELGAGMFTKAQAMATARSVFSSMNISSSKQNQYLLDMQNNAEKAKLHTGALYMGFRNLGWGDDAAWSRATLISKTVAMDEGEIRRQQAKVLSEAIMAKNKQETRKGTSILQNIKEAFAFPKGKYEGSIWRALLAGLPGRQIDFESPTGRWEDVDYNILFRSRFSTLEDWVDYSMQTKEGTAVNTVGMALSGIMGAGRLSWRWKQADKVYRILNSRLAVTGRFNKKDFDSKYQKIMQKNYGITFDTKKAREYFSDKKNLNYGAFLGFINRQRVAAGLHRIRYKDALNDTTLIKAFGDYALLTRNSKVSRALFGRVANTNNFVRSIGKGEYLPSDWRDLYPDKLYYEMQRTEETSKDGYTLGSLSEEQKAKKLNEIANEAGARINKAKELSLEKRTKREKLSWEGAIGQLKYDRTSLLKSGQRFARATLSSDMKTQDILDMFRHGKITKAADFGKQVNALMEYYEKGAGENADKVFQNITLSKNHRFRTDIGVNEYFRNILKTMMGASMLGPEQAWFFSGKTKQQFEALSPDARKKALEQMTKMKTIATRGLERLLGMDVPSVAPTSAIDQTSRQALIDSSTALKRIVELFEDVVSGKEIKDIKEYMLELVKDNKAMAALGFKGSVNLK